MSDKQYTNLPENLYGDKKTPGLYIQMYNGARDTKTPGLKRHSFLVKALSNGHGNAAEGSAFLTFNLDKKWLSPGFLKAAGFDVESTPEQDKAAALEIDNMAAASVVADAEAGTIRKGEENASDEEKLASRREGLLSQIRISVGTIYRLQDWDGSPRNASAPLDSFEATKFAGSVQYKKLPQGGTSAEVRVLSCSAVRPE